MLPPLAQGETAVRTGAARAWALSVCDMEKSGADVSRDGGAHEPRLPRCVNESRGGQAPSLTQTEGDAVRPSLRGQTELLVVWMTRDGAWHRIDPNMEVGMCMAARGGGRAFTPHHTTIQHCSDPEKKRHSFRRAGSRRVEEKVAREQAMITCHGTISLISRH